MPNWCSTFITFISDMTPEGNAALLHLHSKIKETDALMRQLNSNKSYWGLWEVALAEIGYGVHISTYKRGYIHFIDDLDVSYVDRRPLFNIECDDAWSPNIGFWKALLQYFYGNHITMLYKASEPGMGIFETNDESLLPYYTLSIYAEGVDELMKYDKLWDTTDPLFAKLRQVDGVYTTEPKWGYDYNYYDKEKRAYTKQKYYMSEPCLEVYVESDEDDIKDYLSNIMTLPPSDEIEDLPDIETMHLYPWEYVKDDELISSEVACDKICASITNESPTELYGLVTPIRDNFVAPYEGGLLNE